MNLRRRAPPGPSGWAKSRCIPTGLTSTGWSTPGCPTSFTLRGCSAASGPNQLGGATGYRDQLQDVLPLTLLEPRLTRAQIVLHASQQFREGDVLKWWHRAPGGGTGLGQRTKASDPHLWLPYVLARYVRESGDRTVLDEVTPFLEADAVPAHEDTWIVIPRVSRESATVYEHARLAIAFTLEHHRRERSAPPARRRLERRHRRARPTRNRD